MIYCHRRLSSRIVCLRESTSCMIYCHRSREYSCCTFTTFQQRLSPPNLSLDLKSNIPLSLPSLSPDYSSILKCIRSHKRPCLHISTTRGIDSILGLSRGTSTFYSLGTRGTNSFYSLGNGTNTAYSSICLLSRRRFHDDSTIEPGMDIESGMGTNKDEHFAL